MNQDLIDLEKKTDELARKFYKEKRRIENFFYVLSKINGEKTAKKFINEIIYSTNLSIIKLYSFQDQIRKKSVLAKKKFQKRILKQNLGFYKKNLYAILSSKGVFLRKKLDKYEVCKKLLDEN